MHKEENTMYKLFYSNEMEIGNYLHFFIKFHILIYKRKKFKWQHNQELIRNEWV